MFTQEDIELFREKGITVRDIEKQLENFREGFPWLKIVRPAVIGDGIVHISDDQVDNWINIYAESAEKLSIMKFVPASGAASRMFKSLFEYVAASKKETTATGRRKLLDTFPEVKEVFENIRSFAFSGKLEELLKEQGLSLTELQEKNDIYKLISSILFDEGLNYGALPKGLLLFHAYEEGARTAMEEHFVEGALYGKDSRNRVNLHFTVSPEHHTLFLELTRQIQPLYEKKFGVHYKVDFSFQKPSTDTIAVDLNNQPLRDNQGLIFRPGGHGALLENLNELEADIVFVKNIDNVAPDRLKRPTVKYKMILGGILLYIQEKVFSYLQEMEGENELSNTKKEEIHHFLRNDLSIESGDIQGTPEEEMEYFWKKLNRPVRVCGMVKNTGEPGGGPFFALNPDGSASPQVVETSQIDMSLEESRELLKNATHFNPVDLVCSLKNYKGEKFDLMKFRDMNTGFISLKSKDGVELKALELPGLWNGAMSDWNTVFVEVPIETFSPVKTINDLLRPEHQ